MEIHQCDKSKENKREEQWTKTKQNRNNRTYNSKQDPVPHSVWWQRATSVPLLQRTMEKCLLTVNSVHIVLLDSTSVLDSRSVHIVCYPTLRTTKSPPVNNSSAHGVFLANPWTLQYSSWESNNSNPSNSCSDWMCRRKLYLLGRTNSW